MVSLDGNLGVEVTKRSDSVGMERIAISVSGPAAGFNKRKKEKKKNWFPSSLRFSFIDLRYPKYLHACAPLLVARTTTNVGRFNWIE
jgi:hypothetical protein